MHFTFLDVLGRHLLDRVWQRHAAGLEHVERQFDVLSHLDRVAIVLMVHKLVHLLLVCLVAGDHGDEMAESDAVAQVFEARDQKAACVVKRVDPIHDVLPLFLGNQVLLLRKLLLLRLHGGEAAHRLMHLVLVFQTIRTASLVREARVVES